MFCGNDRIRNFVEFFDGGILKGAADLFDIHVEDFCENVGIAHSVACDFDSLNGRKAVANHFLQRMLEFRIAVITKFGSKTDHG